jgi:hypothetical protein
MGVLSVLCGASAMTLNYFLLNLAISYDLSELFRILYLPISDNGGSQ